MALDSGPSCPLPNEILQTVISHAEPSQMKHLALVSRDFHDTVSSILYKHIHHTFTETEDEDGLMPVDLLAAVLETLAGGYYNYAKYIKSFSIDADSSNCAKKVTQELKYDYSSGKLLNALLFAALKNASTLETFTWDVGVELSQSFLLALSEKKTLQHLHLRLQKGPSLHSRSIMNTFHTIPPSNSPATNVHHPHHHHPHHPDYISPNPNVFVHPNPPVTYSANHHIQLNSNTRLGRKLGTAKLADAPKNISRFSSLKTLAVLDIDDYEYISEIAHCVANSGPFLQTLKLSFSKNLACKTRTKAANENDSGASADDDADDFHPILPHPPPQFVVVPNESPGSPTQLPSSMAEVRKDRNRQEEALSTILGLSKTKYDPSVDRMFEMAIMAAHRDVQRAHKKTAARHVAFTKVVGKFADDLLASSRKTTAREKHALEKISKAAEICIKKEDLRQSAAAGDLNSSQTPTVTKTASEEKGTDGEVADVAGSSSAENGGLLHNKLLDYLEKLCENTSHPPVFPFEWQDEKPANSGQTSPSLHTEVNNPPPPALLNLNGESHQGELSTAVVSGVNQEKDALSDIVDMEHPDIVDESDEDQQSADEAEGWASKEPSQIDNGKGKMPQKSIEPSTKEEKKGFGFLRAGQGICLENLSLYLVPVRASVLFKGIDVPRLKHLSLLNVGSQSAFWSMLSKLPDSVQLTSIHTDHVTDAFLHALSGFELVTELFLFEQNQKTSTVAPLTPPSTVSVEDLRQKVLKTRLSSLRRLVIRNEHNPGWKLNIKSISTLANHGANLKELMIEVNSEGLHFLMQQITKLRSLSALHILLNIRENSATLLREMRYNVADTICHCPSIPLEYIGLSNSNTRAGAIHVTHLQAIRSSLSAINSEKPAVSRAVSTDGYDTDDEIERSSPILKKDLKRSAVEGVKMWQADTWGMNL